MALLTWPVATGENFSGLEGDAQLDLGVDLACVTDIDPAFGLAGGRRNLGMALARRLITPRGGLFYDPDYGTDVRGYLHAAITVAELAGIGEAVQAECEKDERVQSAEVEAVASAQAGTLTLRIVVTTAAGPFDLVVEASALSVEVLTIAELG